MVFESFGMVLMSKKEGDLRFESQFKGEVKRIRAQERDTERKGIQIAFVWRGKTGGALQGLVDHVMDG